MRVVINSTAGNAGRVVADQLLQGKEDLMIISRDPAMIAGIVNRGARVRYLGPWGSATAFLLERRIA